MSGKAQPLILTEIKSLQPFHDLVPLLPKTKLLQAHKPRTRYKPVPVILLVLMRNVLDHVHSDITAMSLSSGSWRIIPLVHADTTTHERRAV